MHSIELPAIPAHVPRALVRDFDYFAIQPVDGDIHLGWKRRQDESPDIFWTPRNGGHWVVTRGADIRAIFTDPGRFSSIVANIPADSKPFRLPLLEYDPPEHTAYRRLLAPVFTPRALDRFEAIASTLTVDLIEGFRARGRCEFVSEFAQHMPIGIFMHMAGLPTADAAALLPWADLVTRAPDVNDQLRGYGKVVEYLQDKVAARRGRPGEDLLSLVSNAVIDGRALSHDESVAFASLVMFAGLDTVVSSLGFFIRHLALHPEQRHRLRADPAVLPQAIEEILRRHGIVQMARRVRHDLEYGGVAMKQGEMVLLATLWTGLDERLFPDPLRVDFDRHGVLHTAFGFGPHRCIGAPLARIELRTVLREWLARIPEFEIEPGAQVQVRSGKTLAISHLPLSWPV
ncbi:MAG: cytochrome P450 [Gammaproteobacteria bacterium]